MEPELSRIDVIEKIHQVEDPELGMSIVDLGLVYHVRHAGNRVEVDLTLTYPGCPLGPTIIGDIKKQLIGWHGVEDVQVNIVWEPPWQQEMMQPDVLEELRFLGRIR